MPFPSELRIICGPAPGTCSRGRALRTSEPFPVASECSDVSVAACWSLLSPTKCCCHPTVPSLCLYLSGPGQRSRAAVGWRSEAQLWLCNSCRCLHLVIRIWGHLKQGFVISSLLLDSAPVLLGRRGALARCGAVQGCDQMAGWACRCSCLLRARVAEGSVCPGSPHIVQGPHART